MLHGRIRSLLPTDTTGEDAGGLPVSMLAMIHGRSNKATDSTWAVCGNMLATPAIPSL
jgi:hypothetical protein